jgi:hypothetical protein
MATAKAKRAKRAKPAEPLVIEPNWAFIFKKASSRNEGRAEGTAATVLGAPGSGKAGLPGTDAD